jgi:hypothetical protein
MFEQVRDRNILLDSPIDVLSFRHCEQARGSAYNAANSTTMPEDRTESPYRLYRSYPAIQ